MKGGRLPTNPKSSAAAARRSVFADTGSRCSSIPIEIVYHRGMAHVLLRGSADSLIEVARSLVTGGHRVSLEQDHGTSPAERSDAVLGTVEEPGGGGVSLRGQALPTTRASKPGNEQAVHEGERIRLWDGEVGEVLEGAIALSVVHAEGTEAIIAVLGPGDVLLPHPPDGCHVQAQALAPVRLLTSPWAVWTLDGSWIRALSTRVLRAEAWAAARAHPYIEQRLLEVLMLLAEKFGVPHDGGLRITLRITHAQLAAIAGVTRPTVTRMLALLQKQGLVAPIGKGKAQRFCVYSAGAERSQSASA